jgi:bifunctional non-homologous end joining protein LigD
VGGGHAVLSSRRANDWTAKFPAVRAAVETLPVQSAVLDGEVAVLGPDGRTTFQGLQQALGGGAAHLVYFVFDLLQLDGEDLRPRTLEARKAVLQELLARVPAGGVMRFSDHVVGHGPDVFAQACGRGLEGIVSKRRDAPYRSGRTMVWCKVKCTSRQELVIGGYTLPEGARTGLGSIVVGYHDAAGHLRFAGKVGTGFTQKMLGDLHRRLSALEQKECPFEPTPPRASLGRAVRWTRPELVAEVEFVEWTDDGRLRHPSFMGLREDRKAREVVREKPVPVAVAEKAAPAAAKGKRAPAAKGGGASKHGADGAEVLGQRISNPQRPLYPDAGLTKLDLARYYEAVGEAMVPHVAGRPLTLVRCPKGLSPGARNDEADCFYMKHAAVWSPPSLRKAGIRERNKTGQYLVADDAAGLVGLAQMDVLEIHTSNAHAASFERPDRIVLDLDPGPDVPWREVVEAARLVHDVLTGLGLRSFLKTTGGKGLHVLVPLAPTLDWDASLAFSRAVSELVMRQRPAAYTTAMPKQGREKKILLDYLRNNRGSTSVAAFSTRANPKATVSTPVAWDELDTRLRSDAFTVQSVPKRLASLRAEPWPGFFDLKQKLPADIARLL